MAMVASSLKVPPSGVNTGGVARGSGGTTHAVIRVAASATLAIAKVFIRDMRVLAELADVRLGKILKPTCPRTAISSIPESSFIV
jgi:hypothetical protein